MVDFADAARVLESQSNRSLRFQPHFEPLAAREPGRVSAVDGSHAILVDNGAAWVVAVRADAVTWPGRPIETPPAIHATAPADAEDAVAVLYEAHGLPRPVIRSCDQYAEALRDLAEHEAALAALRTSPDLLLLDGALEHVAKAAQPMADRIRQRAAEAGVPVAGVSKRSRLHDEGLPLVTGLMRQDPGGTWAVAVPDYQDTYVAKLHPRAPHAFRIDGDPAPLVPLAKDAVYLGYPYPLALAHNHVCIAATEAHQLRAQLVNEVRVHAGPTAYKLLEDFHETLDRNVP
ncbi:MAG: DNA double-strand break repair nuclease NurA [Thermoplasmatota archaeon]